MLGWRKRMCDDCSKQGRRQRTIVTRLWLHGCLCALLCTVTPVFSSSVQQEHSYVSNWTELSAACDAPSANVTLSPYFDSHDYTTAIDFTSKRLVVVGNNAVLDAHNQGGFFIAYWKARTRNVLVLYNLTMLNAGHYSGNAQFNAVSVGSDTSVLKVYDCTFSNNTVSFVIPGYGTSWICSHTCDYTAAKCSEAQAHQLCANGHLCTTCVYGGGAIGVYNNGSAEVYASTFVFNRGTIGGAVTATSGTLKFYDSVFTQNQATGSHNGGGALCLHANAMVEIWGCVFTSNRALHGGAIASRDSTVLKVHNSSFDSNAAIRFGGALYLRDAAAMDILSCTFVSNGKADARQRFDTDEVLGGAIFAENTVTVQVCTTTFLANAASIGGAVYVSGGAAHASIYDCVFTQNVALGLYAGGGAIFADSATVNTIRSVFRANVAAFVSPGVDQYRGSTCRESPVTQCYSDHTSLHQPLCNGDADCPSASSACYACSTVSDANGV